MEKYWCAYCELQITNGTHCEPCFEYDGAVNLQDFVAIFGYQPKVAA